MRKPKPIKKQALNKKIAEWRFSGAEITVTETAIRVGHSVAQHPDYPNMISQFTESVNTCLKWLPLGDYSVSFTRVGKKVTCRYAIHGGFHIFIGQARFGEEALAFCLAWEKLIDRGIEIG